MKRPKFKAGIRPDVGPWEFRSSWESNFCRLLQHLKIRFEYEPRRFFLSKKISYLPDFHLLSDNPWKATWIEVKGFWSKFDKKRLLMFSKKYPKENLVVIGRDKYKLLAKEYGAQIDGWEGFGKKRQKKGKGTSNGR